MRVIIFYFQIKKLTECDRFKVAVPLMVLEEIRGLCKSESKAEDAGIALDVVEKLISSKAVSLLTSMVRNIHNLERGRLFNNFLFIIFRHQPLS